MSAENNAVLAWHFWLSWALAGFSVVVQFIPFAPYGRYFRGGWGVGVPSKYAWMVFESPSFFVPIYLWIKGHDIEMCLSQKLLLLAFLTHYANRCFIYPMMIKKGKPTALSALVAGCLFTSLNGFLQGWWIIHMWPKESRSMLFIIPGLTLWLLGFAINVHSDSILRNLRKTGEGGYQIPRGGLFEHVSAANYFGEIVEWVGFALACGSTCSWAFAVFTLSFLGARGTRHHNWYKEKFEDYPAGRKAVIPFVY